MVWLVYTNPITTARGCDYPMIEQHARISRHALVYTETIITVVCCGALCKGGVA